MSDDGSPALRQSLSRWSVAVYGVGTILGAGIYVVVGKVAGHAGALAPFAFLLAACAALLTGFSYAELAARIPESGGSAAFVARGFRRGWLTAVCGWALIATGLVSAATIATGFAGYLGVFVEVPKAVTIPLAIAAMTIVAGAGLKQAAWVMTLTTALEVAGLAIVIIYAGPALSAFPAAVSAELATGPAEGIASGIVLASVLGFYAFVGFEDIATLSEEVKDSSRAVPFAILFSLGFSLALYLVVSAIAVSALDLSALRRSEAPLADVVGEHGGPAGALAVISLLTILNGALAQIVMASRVIHDLGTRRGGAPRWMATINSATGTPLTATGLCGVVVAILALFLPTETLAATTSIIILLIFAAACCALLLIKRRGDPLPEGARAYPAIIPALGAATCIALVAAQFLLA